MDPNRRCPAYLNGSDIVESEELDYFKRYGFIRVIGKFSRCDTHLCLAHLVL